MELIVISLVWLIMFIGVVGGFYYFVEALVEDKLKTLTVETLEEIKANAGNPERVYQITSAAIAKVKGEAAP
jgi:hypothetical protein